MKNKCLLFEIIGFLFHLYFTAWKTADLVTNKFKDTFTHNWYRLYSIYCICAHSKEIKLRHNSAIVCWGRSLHQFYSHVSNSVPIWTVRCIMLTPPVLASRRNISGSLSFIHVLYYSAFRSQTVGKTALLWCFYQLHKTSSMSQIIFALKVSN